jgi:CubicO group peptidase (beta-lactamase class C family)
MRRPCELATIAAITISLCLSACGGGDGDGDPAPLPTPVAPAAGRIGDGRIPELVEWARAAQNAPAMAVVIVRNGQVVERAAVGRRSINNSATVTLDDRWHMGSMTKAMTATLAATLVEDGLIEWETTPIDVWPELASSIHASFRNATLRQFLSHTSGMQRDDEYGPASNNAPGTVMQKRREWTAHVLQRAAQFPAGQSNYSNIGYMVAGAMLEARGGAAWETLLTDRVFVPLGMTQTGFGAPGTSGRFDQPLGHWSRSDGFAPIDPGSAEADIPVAVGPAGTVHTTLNDYARFMLTHIGGARGSPGVVSVAAFQTLHGAVAGNYALGWGTVPTFQTLNAPGLGHTGSTGRWFSLVWLAPSLDAGVMIAVNGGGERASAAITALDMVLRERLMASP